MRGLRVALLGVITLNACGLDSAYVCNSDAQCNDGGIAGRCEADGYCSFQDDECASGRRYGVWAPASVARLCVDNSAAPTSTVGTSTGQPSSTGSTSTPGTSTTQDATTLATTLGSADESSSSSSSDSTGSESSSSGSIDVLDPDLIAWYRFDSIEGGSVADHSGNDHVATCDVCPTSADGVYNDAIETDGVAQHLVVANTPALEMETWTIAAWVWSEAPPTSFLTIVGKPLGIGVANSYEMGMNTAGFTTRVVAGWSDDVESQGLAVALPALQQWFHVTATFGETTATLYLDGVVADEEPLVVVPAFDASDLYIAADVDSQAVDNFFLGRIDDLRIYRRALTEDEVGVIMAGQNL